MQCGIKMSHKVTKEFVPGNAKKNKDVVKTNKVK